MPIRHAILITFAAAILAGCHASPSTTPSQAKAPIATPPAPFHPVYFTMFGTHTTPDQSWRIGISQTSLDLARSDAFSDGKGFTISGWTTTSPQGWNAHAGWFAYVENGSRVWAYDGDRQLFLETETASGNNFAGRLYCNSGFPCAVPEEVLSHLSELGRKAVETNQ